MPSRCRQIVAMMLAVWTWTTTVADATAAQRQPSGPTASGTLEDQGQPLVSMDGIDRNWVGTYLVEDSRWVADARDPAGRRWITSGPAPLNLGERIAARVGVRFGVGFTIRGLPAGAEVEVRRIWRFPPLTNPETGVALSRSEHVFICRLGESCFTGQFLAQEFEVKAGTWTVELWAGSTKLLEQAFLLFSTD